MLIRYMPRQRACNASEFREKERMSMAEKTDEQVAKADCECPLYILLIL